MQISPSVRAVQVPDENPMHPLFTSIYLVGKDGAGEALSIDSGEAVDRYRWMLRGYLAATERAEVALAGVTHHHLDHSGNLKWLRESLKAEVLVTEEGKPLLGDRLPDDGLRTVREGEVINLDGGVRVQVLLTPGHSPDSICFYIEEEGVLFSGDTLLGSSTTTVHNLGQYRSSLKRLLDLPKLEVICPGHGAVVNDPQERLQMYVEHRNQRERQILETLAQGGDVIAVPPTATFRRICASSSTTAGCKSSPVYARKVRRPSRRLSASTSAERPSRKKRKRSRPRIARRPSQLKRTHRMMSGKSVRATPWSARRMSRC
jgi:ribonuclease/clavin/mitogillin